MEPVGGDTVALRALIVEGRELVLGFGIAMARMVGMFAVVPILKRTELGRTLVAIFALAMSLPIAVGIVPNLEPLEIDQSVPLALLIAKEFLIGAFLGVLLAVPFWAVNVAGDVIDTQRSIGQSGVDDPVTKEQTSVMSALLMLAVITAFISSGGFEVMTGTIYASYAIWPLEQYTPRIDAASRAAILPLLADVIWLGIIVAGPFVALFLISDFAVAGLSRLAGRIELASALPLIKNIVFVIFLILYMTYLLQFATRGLLERSEVLDVLRLFRGTP